LSQAPVADVEALTWIRLAVAAVDAAAAAHSFRRQARRPSSSSFSADRPNESS
jgi:hypothetical protein